MLSRENSLASYERKFRQTLTFTDGKWVYISGFCFNEAPDSDDDDDDSDCVAGEHLQWIGYDLATQKTIKGNTELEYNAPISGWYRSNTTGELVLLFRCTARTYKVGVSIGDNYRAYLLHPNNEGPISVDTREIPDFNTLELLTEPGRYISPDRVLTLYSGRYWRVREKLFYGDCTLGVIMSPDRILPYLSIPDHIQKAIYADINENGI